MIVRSKPTLWDVIFTLKGSIAKRIAIKMLVMTALAAIISALAMRHPELFSRLSATPFTLVGLSLSIFLSFRNSACYDRWWEGRKQWGQLVVDIRCIAREVAPLRDDPAHRTMLRSLCGFLYAFAAQLRGEDARAAAAPWLETHSLPTVAPNVADAILSLVGAECSRLAARGAITEWRYMLLEARLVSISGVQAACERIKMTPLPFAYTLLLHRTAYLFCLLLPFGLAGVLGWATPLLTAIVSYTFFGLDALGDELEDPFGRDVNDLPLSALVRTMERDLMAALGEPVPDPLDPVDFLLQ